MEVIYTWKWRVGVGALGAQGVCWKGVMKQEVGGSKRQGIGGAWWGWGVSRIVSITPSCIFKFE